MANTYVVRGLEPYGDLKTLPEEFTVDTSNTEALFVGSAFYLVNGVARALPEDGSTGAIASDQAIKGRVMCIRNSAGKPVQNLPAATAGFIEGTTDRDQLYQITVDDTGYADADAGDMYDLLLETGTANANGLDGDGASKQQLDGSSKAADAHFTVLGRVRGMESNDASTIGTVVYGKISASNYQVGAA